MVRADEDALTHAIIGLASEYGRYGYRGITWLLRDAGWAVGTDRVQRICRREGLKVPSKQRPRSSLWLNDGFCIRLRPERSRHPWIRQPRCNSLFMPMVQNIRQVIGSREPPDRIEITLALCRSCPAN